MEICGIDSEAVAGLGTEISFRVTAIRHQNWVSSMAAVPCGLTPAAFFVPPPRGLRSFLELTQRSALG